MENETKTVTLQGEPGPVVPALSLLRRFSAPLIVRMEASLEERLQLLAKDDDPFIRWDSAQGLFRQVLIARAEGACRRAGGNGGGGSVVPTPGGLWRATLIRLRRPELAALLALPGLPELEALQTPVDPPALFEAASGWCRDLGLRLRSELIGLLEQTRQDWVLTWPAGQGARQLTAVAWRWLVASKDAQACSDALAAVSGPSMTLARSALRALQPVAVPERGSGPDCVL